MARPGRLLRHAGRAALAAVLLLAACAEQQEPVRYNATDVMYLQMMLAHHEPSAKLLALGRERATRPDVRTMATELGAQTAADADAMAVQLRVWGRPTTTDHDPAHHESHGPGLHALGDTELAELAATAPEAFDIAFVTVLVGHQHNAVELARMETDEGLHPDVVASARRTDERLRAQIQQMLRMIA
jgi:uncharacterized protein (DUF305 family)